jgi:hypothetical protein
VDLPAPLLLAADDGGAGLVVIVYSGHCALLQSMRYTIFFLFEDVLLLMI